MKKKVTLALMLTTLICNNILAAKNLEREVRECTSFTAISVGDGIDVYITQADKHSIEVEASNNQMHRIITEIKGNTLHIYVKGKFRWGLNEEKKVYISAPTYQRISASGGADIRSASLIKSSELNLKSSGGADIYLSVELSSLIMNCSGGADISIEGTTEQLTASASGGSDINAKKLKAKYADVSASGGGDIEVYVSESLTAKASGGGDIKYTGSPTKKNIQESGGGDVYSF